MRVAVHTLIGAFAFLSACTLEALPTRDVATNTGDATNVDGVSDVTATDAPMIDVPVVIDSPIVTDSPTSDGPVVDAPVDAPHCTASALDCPDNGRMATPGCMYGRCNAASDCGSLGTPWGCATPTGGADSIVPGIGIAGGVCTRLCNNDSDCPCSMNCLFVYSHNFASMRSVCLPACTTSNSECLTGWRCAMDDQTPPNRWCAPACAADTDCPGAHCDSTVGTCYP